jgi:hypothetical protein
LKHIPAPTPVPAWSRSETLALAQHSCVHCWSLGLCIGKAGVERPCDCVLRAIFRACYARFRRCASKEKFVSRIGFDADPDRGRRRVWGMKNEEYMADFSLIAKRELGEGTLSHRLFTYHFLLGADWQLCGRKLSMDRGEIFHEIYRVQARLGRAFRETRPYSLFPLDEYFGGATGAGDRVSRAHRVASQLTLGGARTAQGRASHARLRPPLGAAQVF